MEGDPKTKGEGGKEKCLDIGSHMEAHWQEILRVPGPGARPIHNVFLGHAINARLKAYRRRSMEESGGDIEALLVEEPP